MKKLRRLLIILSLGILLAGCGSSEAGEDGSEPAEQIAAYSEEAEAAEQPEPAESESESGRARQAAADEAEDAAEAADEVTYIDVPVYAGKAYTEINGNVPFFTEDELSDTSYEAYAELDDLGRCGPCMASVGQDIMPTKEREAIGEVKPTGWHTVKYEGIVDGNYLYNRCHLLGYQLTGENANRQNLITGTRYMNTEGMLPFENMVADYVKETGNHVMYRVTPLFDGDNLVADGVLMEAKSVEDDGADILFNVFCYNVQPGISIDYATGESSLDGSAIAQEEGGSAKEGAPASVQEQQGRSAQKQQGRAAQPEQAQASEPQPQEQQSQIWQDSSQAVQSQQDSQPPAEQAQVPEPQPNQQPQAQPEQQEMPVQQASPAGSGAYAVNAKNGKIHIVGACPATGTSSKAMSEPKYFDTYEEAEAYSVSIAPGESKRQCGNCW